MLRRRSSRMTGCQRTLLRRWLLAAAIVLTQTLPVAAAELPEYRLKAMFVYNFVLFTEWPEDVGGTLALCVVGSDPFGVEIDVLSGKQVGSRSIRVHRMGIGAPLKDCQIVFIAAPAIDVVAQILAELRGCQVLTIADSPGAARQGVALNLAVTANRVSFEANLRAARDAGLNLSSKLLRLATQVIQ